MKCFRRLGWNVDGATSVEFAMVLPLFLILLLGIVDAGRFMWEYNRAEKATQMGARYAVATNLVPGTAFADYSFAEDAGIPQGGPIPTSEFDYVRCEDGSCPDCVGGDVCGTVAFDSAAFGNVVDRMAAMYPVIGADNVTIEYRNVGLGYSGDPNGPDVAPLVTVGLQELQFNPISCFLLCSVTMPDFRAGLTLEDGSGTVAN